MDPDFIKWMSEALARYAGGARAMEKIMGKEGGAGDWPFWKGLPGLAPPPFSPEKMEDLTREWLLLFGAVPQKDHDELKRELEQKEAEVAMLRQALENMVRGLSTLEEAPEALKPWLELADKTAKAQVEWFGELAKIFDRQASGPEED